MQKFEEQEIDSFKMMDIGTLIFLQKSFCRDLSATKPDTRHPARPPAAWTEN